MRGGCLQSKKMFQCSFARKDRATIFLTLKFSSAVACCTTPDAQGATDSFGFDQDFHVRHDPPSFPLKTRTKGVAAQVKIAHGLFVAH